MRILRFANFHLWKFMNLFLNFQKKQSLKFKMIVLHPKSVQRLKWQIQQASFLKTIPYEFNQTTGRLETYKRAQDKWLYWFSFWLIFFYSSFIHVRLYETLLTKDMGTVNRIHLAIHFAWIAGSTLALVGNCCLWYQTLEVADFVNSFLVFIDNIQGKHSKLQFILIIASK